MRRTLALGLTTSVFAYEAAGLALPLALSAAVFYRRPTMVMARRMFFGSLMYLPVFQVLCCLHRVPREEGATQPLVLRIPERWWAWSQWSVGGWTAWGEGLDRLGASLEETSHAPFPFLPLPVWPERCPHQVECQGAEGAGGKAAAAGAAGAGTLGGGG